MFTPTVISGGRGGSTTRSRIAEVLFNLKVLELERVDLLKELDKQNSLVFYLLVGLIILSSICLSLAFKCLQK